MNANKNIKCWNYAINDSFSSFLHVKILPYEFITCRILI